MHEGLQILFSNMKPSEVSRFWAACNIGSSNYLKLKDEFFAEESVAGLYDKILEFQNSKNVE
ncbi:hypothetical protein H6G17_01355 [Chroococcidiopsis sp. FACHB-1243]|uniref:hypothetical protein n=1 Tax=Chroococcidiopsis sp. [FACHB-1243] TaxID=2692781 RepID=UPI001786FCA7|nr:hypothetical protein [Chroococcidiopsis sp. [FACHB-1243]]MBD2304169.1 hypothetical protein [Chroococcidiopsis sp. [FACHB-1243]]